MYRKIMYEDPHRKAREKAAERNQAYLDALKEQGKKHTAPNLDELTRLAKIFWPHSYGAAKHTPNFDLDAFTILVSHLEKTDEWLANSVMLLPAVQINMMWSCRWADQGFPVFQIGHKYAASLMATGISKLDADHIVAPFKAFCINLPAGLLFTEHEGEIQDFVRLYAHQLTKSTGEIVWNIQLNTVDDVSLWKHGVPTELLCEENLLGETDWQTYSFSLPTVDSDTKVMSLAGRLLLGVCLTLSSPDGSKLVGKGHRYEPEQLREMPEPLHRVYQVGRPINLDVRDEVRAYLSGETKKAPSVQTLVRGHWRRVAHGQAHAGRRWTQIEPYWRGPEEAPILVRPIKVKP